MVAQNPLGRLRPVSLSGHFLSSPNAGIIPVSHIAKATAPTIAAVQLLDRDANSATPYFASPSRSFALGKRMPIIAKGSRGGPYLCIWNKCGS